jgi:hypothetical protein
MKCPCGAVTQTKQLTVVFPLMCMGHLGEKPESLAFCLIGELFHHAGFLQCHFVSK